MEGTLLGPRDSGAVSARPAQERRPALLQQMTRSILIVAALACAATSLLFLSGVWVAAVNEALAAIYGLIAVSSSCT